MVTVHPVCTVVGTAPVRVMTLLLVLMPPEAMLRLASHDPLGLVSPLAVTCWEAASSGVVSSRRVNPY